jgi:hypothetical protein
MARRMAAGLAGAFYLATIATGIFVEYAREALVASGNPAASARNILALTLWLLIVGVDVTEWREEAGSNGVLA